MGDLHGMPNVVDPDETISGDEYTVYSPPDWVPREDGPGILLLDDINRADDRILRGCMQLLQNFELTSWKLPQNGRLLLLQILRAETIQLLQWMEQCLQECYTQH